MQTQLFPLEMSKKKRSSFSLLPVMSQRELSFEILMFFMASRRSIFLKHLMFCHWVTFKKLYFPSTFLWLVPHSKKKKKKDLVIKLHSTLRMFLICLKRGMPYSSIWCGWTVTFQEWLTFKCQYNQISTNCPNLRGFFFWFDKFKTSLCFFCFFDKLWLNRRSMRQNVISTQIPY